MMTTVIDLKQLNQSEKLRLFELLWQDLSVSAAFESPQWHHHELVDTQKKIEGGEVHFLDWSAAKQQLLKK